ncbi:MAG: hypothetical protein ACOY0T_30855 [Myxococcota bacterium]
MPTKADLKALHENENHFHVRQRSPAVREAIGEVTLAETDEPMSKLAPMQLSEGTAELTQA